MVQSAFDEDGRWSDVTGVWEMIVDGRIDEDRSGNCVNDWSSRVQGTVDESSASTLC
jgi:hypothetical protein